MNRRTEFFRRWLALFCLLTQPLILSAYVTQKDSSNIYVVVWPPGAVTMQLKLPAPAGPLLDGSTTYTAPILAALQQWNNVMGMVRLEGQVAASGSYATGNDINEIAMDSKADGEDFGENTLAITLSYRVGNEKTEADIVFNTAYTWDSYRGALRSDRMDIQRVAAHELGHVLGLGHPNEAEPAQNVVALMNSTISSGVETPRTDDINGIRSLYGAPGFVPANDMFAQAAVLRLDGPSVNVTGTNIAATAEAGEPNHDTETAARSVWWLWTAPSNVPVTLTTMGSNFDTVVGVYTGSSVGSLTMVASNDDEESGVVRSSKLAFAPAAGTTYSIAVDGWEASFGQIALALTQSAASGSAPSITAQPSSQTVSVGGSVTFRVSAGGAPTGYQWFFNGSPVSGATADAYSLNNIKAADAGSYHVVVTNASGSVTSNTVTLTVQSGVVTSQVVTSGREVTLAAPVGVGTYQWQVSTNAGTSWSDVSNGSAYTGATTATLTISAVTTAMNGNRYRYVVTGSGGTATGAAITLTVSPPLVAFPEGIALDGAGNLYVTDSSTHVVLKITPNGQTTTLAGSNGNAGSADGTGTAARFNQPTGISGAPNATLTVADSANAIIRRVSSSAVVNVIAGSPTIRGNSDGPGLAATFGLPVGLAQNNLGTFYIADATNHTIRALDSLNTVTTFAGVAGHSGAADGPGTAARFNYPTGIAVDAAGNVFVADTTNNLIRKITPVGVVITLAGVVAVSGWQDGTGGGALFNQPRGLAVDTAGNLYVADTGNSVIRKITPAGAVTTLAGLSTIGGLKDGIGSEAWFNQPRAVALDTVGNLYVADTGNAAIRKITPAGSVTTLALSVGTTSSSGSSSSGGTTITVPVTGSSSSSGGGGGGGAPSQWFLGAGAGLVLLRWLLIRRT